MDAPVNQLHSSQIPERASRPSPLLFRAYRKLPRTTELFVRIRNRRNAAVAAEVLYTLAKDSSGNYEHRAFDALSSGSKSAELLRDCLSFAEADTKPRVAAIADHVTGWFGGDRAGACEFIHESAQPTAPALLRVLAHLAVEAGSRRADLVAVVVEDDFKTNFVRLLPLERNAGSSVRMKRAFAHIRSDTQLLRHGYSMPSARHLEPIADSVRGRALYLAHGSLPYETSGYAVRTHGLLRGLVAAGIEAEVVTRLGFPEETAAAGNPPGRRVEQVDDIAYHRLADSSAGIGKVPSIEYITENLKAHYPLIREFRPAVVHAASNYINGVTAGFIARKFGIASIYEVRGLWHLTRASLDPGFAETDAWSLYERMEIEACENADRIICITAALRDALVARGVDGDKIDLVPNGVDPDRFRKAMPDRALAASLGLDPDRPVVGYVGSLVGYEGIDDLLRAIGILRGKSRQAPQVLIVGQGPVLEPARSLAAELGIADIVHFTGQVPHTEVERYYSLISIAPFPRKPLPVCEMVSPLKPFEAMAMEKCVVVSSVAALAEIVDHGRTGMVFEKGSVDSLASTLDSLLTDQELGRRLGEAARRWVLEHRDWHRLGARVAEIHLELADRAGRDIGGNDGRPQEV